MSLTWQSHREKHPERYCYVNFKKAVKRGQDVIAVARSSRMAKTIAEALNQFQPYKVTQEG